MDYPTSPLEKLLHDAKEYVTIQRQLISTVVSKKGADVAYIVVAGALFVLLGLFIAIFLSFTLAYGLALLLDNVFLGFLIVTLLYILIFVMLWIFKDRLIKIPILKLFLRFFDTNKPTNNEPVA
jgi:hypothetical protein